MKHFSHLNTATDIINLYKGNPPFHLFIRDFFKQDKKYGSKDRRQITHLCYCYFRLGLTLQNLPVQERILIGLFLCSGQYNELLSAIQPVWNENVALLVEEKYALLKLPNDAANIFPFESELSEGINKNDFSIAHLVQPDLFIRERPGFHETVTGKLEKAAVAFSSPYPGCIRLANTTKVDELLAVNKEVVIQDYSSQRTGAFMQLAGHTNPLPKTWDCCAASGGKSIMAKDRLGAIDLTVSDIRSSVLANLEKRFAAAGIKKYKLLKADLASPATKNLPDQLGLIIADVPCTGSGTWGRSPERLSFFDKKEIDKFSQLQKKIITATLPRLQTGGYFLYITCSVFKKENEEVVTYIQQNYPVELIKMEVLEGYTLKADTMFAALLRKRL
ncbi:MAG: Fmu (Sun) domain-containing protein [Chitinophagaceae bacterium]